MLRREAGSGERERESKDKQEESKHNSTLRYATLYTPLENHAVQHLSIVNGSLTRGCRPRGDSDNIPGREAVVRHRRASDRLSLTLAVHPTHTRGQKTNRAKTKIHKHTNTHDHGT